MSTISDLFENNSPQKIAEVTLKVLTGLAASYYLLLFLYIGFSRFSFPFTFDWVEGAILVQVNRVLLGQNLYVEPSAAYVPLVYQPLYFYAAALFSKLFGLGFAPLRILSILASCGCLLVIFLITRQVTSSNFPGLVSAGFFAATNGIVWTWFDFAKVDMLGIFLSLLGLYFLLRNNTRSAILAGVFLALSFFTKQSALIIIFPAFSFYFWVNRKSTLLAMLTFSLLTLTGTLFLMYTSDNWYLLYAYTLPSYHRLDTNPKQIEYVVTSLLEPILWFCGLVCVAILTNFKKLLRDHRSFFFLGLAGSTLALSLFSSLGIGSTRNAFIPAYALIAIVCGIGLYYLQEKLASILSGKGKFIGTLLLFGVCLWQFLSLYYFKARDYIPSEQDLKRGQVLIKYLQNSDGEFMISTQNYLALYANRKVYYHEAALGEFTGWYGKSLPEAARIHQEVQQVVQSGAVTFVYLPDPSHDWGGMSCEKVETLHSRSKFVPTLYKMSCH